MAANPDEPNRTVVRSNNAAQSTGERVGFLVVMGFLFVGVLFCCDDGSLCRCGIQV
jgi:hypothetical protein